MPASHSYKTFHSHHHGFKLSVLRSHFCLLAKITLALQIPRLTMSGANLPDIERGESHASCGAETCHVRARQPPQSRQFNFAIQPLNGASHLIDVVLQETAQGDLVFYQARTCIFRAAAGRWYKRCLMKVFTKCNVGTAKVHQVGTVPSDICSLEILINRSLKRSCYARTKHPAFTSATLPKTWSLQRR